MISIAMLETSCQARPEPCQECDGIGCLSCGGSGNAMTLAMDVILDAAPLLIAIAKAAAAHLTASESSAVGDDYWQPFFETKAKLREALAGVTP